MLFLLFINLPLFLIGTLLFFLIPGLVILDKSHVKASVSEKLILSLSIGFASITLLSYVLLYFKIGFILLPIVAVVDLFWIRTNLLLLKDLRLNLSSFKNFTFQHLIILTLFAFGVIGQLAVISPSGILSGNGDLLFWSSHGHDSSWHIALIEEMEKNFPPQMPVFAGERLVNYHFFSDISLAIFNQYLNIPLLDLYFRFFPLFYSLLLGGAVFFLVKKMGYSFTVSCWAVFFTYFAGSFGYFVTYLQNKTISGETTFGSTQIQSSIGNPPQITASFLLLFFLYFFICYLEKNNKYIFLLCVLFSSVLIVFKVYAGVVLLPSLFLVGLWRLIKEKKPDVLVMSITASLVSLGLYLPNTANSSSFLIWEPWWYIRTMVIYSNKLNWMDLELRRETYLAEGNLKRVIFIETTSFLIFFFGNLGMRFLGLWQFLKFSKTIFRNYFSLLILLIILISFTAPMLFLQKGVASNSIQFLQYFLLLFGILAGVTTANLLARIKSSYLKKVVVIAIIILTVPSQVGLLYGFYSKPANAKIDHLELEALNFLKYSSDKNSVVLTPPFDKFVNIHISTPPIWAWSDTGYVSAFSSRKTYLADTEQVDITGYDYQKRLQTQKDLFENSNAPETFNSALKNINISYLYFPKLERPKIDLSKTSLIKVFDNQEVEVWKIN